MSDQWPHNIQDGNLPINYYMIYKARIKPANTKQACKMFINTIKLVAPTKNTDRAINRIIYDAMGRFSNSDKFLIRELGKLRSKHCEYNDLILRAIRDTDFTDSDDMIEISTELMSHKSCHKNYVPKPNIEIRDYIEFDNYPQALKVYNEYSVGGMIDYGQFYSMIVCYAYYDTIVKDILIYWFWRKDYRMEYHALVLYIAQNADDKMMAAINNDIAEFVWFLFEFDEEWNQPYCPGYDKELDLDRISEIYKEFMLRGLDYDKEISDEKSVIMALAYSPYEQLSKLLPFILENEKY